MFSMEDLGCIAFVSGAVVKMTSGELSLRLLILDSRVDNSLVTMGAWPCNANERDHPACTT